MNFDSDSLNHNLVWNYFWLVWDTAAVNPLKDYMDTLREYSLKTALRHSLVSPQIPFYGNDGCSYHKRLLDGIADINRFPPEMTPFQKSASTNKLTADRRRRIQTMSLPTWQRHNCHAQWAKNTFYFSPSDFIMFSRVSGMYVLAGQVVRSYVCVSRVTLRAVEGERAVIDIGKDVAYHLK